MAEQDDHRVGEGRHGPHVVLRETALVAEGYVELVAMAEAVVVTGGHIDRV